MLNRVARAFPYLLLVPAVLPLIFIDGLLYPYLAPKTFLFRADALFVFAAFAVLALSGQSFFFSRLRNRLTWIPVLFLAWAYIASLVGIDFYHSFWSVYDRGDGLLTLTCIVGFFYVLLVSIDERFVERLMKVVAVVGTLVASLALLQWIQDAGLPLPLVPDSPGRIGSTLGNAAYLASYLCISLFVTIAIAPYVSAKWQNRAYGAAALQCAAIFASATRGAMLGLLFAGAVTLAYVAWKGQGAVKRYARFGVVGFLLVISLFFGFRQQLANVPFEPVKRLASTSVSDATVESRLFILRTVGAEAFRSPVFGVGAEHVEVLFNRVYDPTGIIEQWFDRAHNAYLDYFVQYGIPGLILYGAIIATFIWRAFLWAREGSARTSYMGKIFLLLIGVYAFQNLFLFDTALSLWLLFALLASFFVAGEKASSLPVPRVPLMFSGAVGLLIALLIIPVSLTPLYANLLLGGGYLYHVADVDRSIRAMEKGYGLGTYADLEYGYQLYAMYTEQQMVQLKGVERLEAYRFAEKVLSQNFENYQYDARTATYYAHILDVSPPEVSVNEPRLREVIQRAIELSPKRIQPWYLLANISIRAGDALPQGSASKNRFYAEGIATLSEYASRVPLFAEPRFVIATLYLTMDDRAEAAVWAERGLAVYKPDEPTAKRASRYYITIEDWGNAIRFLSDIVEFSPEDYPVKYDLAKAEFLAGNVERARGIVAELQKEAPGLVETDAEFLQAVLP